MLDFRPPKDSPAMIWLVKALLPLICKFQLHDLRVEVVGDGLTRFRSLKGKRTVICPNHPNRNDPDVMMSFSKMAAEDFNFLAAREVFDWNHGLRGWFFQKLGCYSVVRGAVDRESFKTTKNLIVSGKKKLVIYPEGEISRQNDTLMPLESGVAQMAFWALDELCKRGSAESVQLLPIANKYTYIENITGELETSLWKLEHHLGIQSDVKQPLYERLRAVALKLLSALEREYSFEPVKYASLNDRIVGLRSFILKNIASFLQITLPSDGSQLDWIRIVRNALDDFIYMDSEELSAYEKQIHDQKAEKIRGFYRDLDRVVNFIAIYDGYLREHMTQERFADVIDRFEWEIFGELSSKGPRLVKLDVGRPIDLADYYADYKANKRATISKVNDELSAQISTMLQAQEKKRSPIFML